MVYGLNVQPVHGYYIETKFDSTGGKVKLLDETPDDGVNPRGREFTCGRPVDPTYVPKRAHYLDRQKHPLLPDFLDSGYISVSTRVKEMIEQFDPDVHQFFPVEYLDIDGAHMENR